MIPLVREYTNDEQLKDMVEKLKNEGLDNEEIYILSHDDDRTERISKSVYANTIGASEQDAKSVLTNIFSKKGDELRTKMQEIGFSKEEAGQYEEDLDEGKVLLIITNPAKAQAVLT
ncbi:general stress protein [Halobacillus litoralis]|uniref:general stress protein n=1 Tax=Halobacillus litoralis TaxID=45668 RepID=UPI001CD1CD56|nr:general stress protein [Halobacillus litoralis]MCA1023741.1 general stress protein [Halobacillus litoralis]